MTPLVSVVIPAYNAERHIGASIESVLAQTMDDFEVVVSDDCSTDGTMEVVRSFTDRRVRVLENDRNLGPAGNWNRVTREAAGRYVKLLCDDDLLYPTCLERQAAALDSGGPSVAFAASPRDIVDEVGRVLIRKRGLAGMSGVVDRRTLLRRTVQSGTNIFGEPVSVLMRGDALRAAGAWSDTAQYVIDLDMWCRLLDHGDAVVIPEALGVFRVLESSWSTALAHTQNAQTRELFRQLRARHPDVVTRSDLVVGSVRAPLLSLARRAAYRLLRARARKERT